MSIQRKVERIIDGNTFAVDKKIGNTKIVHLAGINSRDQIKSREAIDQLNKLIGGKIVTIVPVKQKIRRYVHRLKR